MLAIGGYDKLKERHFTYYETIAGGMGARPNSEGINASSYPYDKYLEYSCRST